MRGLLQDLKQAFRLFRTRPALTSLAVVTLALGIGASTTVFSALDALLIRPLPVPGADRLVAGVSLREGFDPFGTSLLEYATYRESQALASSGIASARSFNVVGAGEPERLTGAAVSAGYLETLGVTPLRGRLFTAEDDRSGGPALAIISAGLWDRRFGRARDVVGRTLDLDGRGYTIVGVLPAGFDLPYGGDVWTPLQADLDTAEPRARTTHAYEVVARLRPGVSPAQADSEVKSLAVRLARDHPDLQRGWSYRLVPLRQFLIGDLEGRVARGLLILAASVGLLLLISSVNVANLLLALGVARQRELALRVALGAARLRILRLLLTESVALGLAGGAGGLALAFLLAPAVATLSPLDTVSLSGFFHDFRIDGRAQAVAVGLSIVTSAIFGSIAALRSSGGVDVRAALADGDRQVGGSRARRRWLDALAVGEIAMAASLLVGSGLLIKSFTRLVNVDVGFAPDRLAVVQLALSPEKYGDHARRVDFVDRVLAGVRAMPGAVAAGVSTNIPLQQLSFDAAYEVEGRPHLNPNDVPFTAHRLVTPGYLQALGVTLVRGRLLVADDRAGTLPVAVVSEALARDAWPDADPIGKRVRRLTGSEPSPWLTVVGVVRDVKEDRFNFRIDRPVWYLPYAQVAAPLSPDPPLNLVVRASGDPAALVPAIRDAVHAVDPTQPVSNATTMTAHVRGVLTAERSNAALMGVLASLGLLLASIGLYGVMAFAVRQRTSEIGVRVALGAAPRDIMRLVIGRGLALVAMGLAAGLAVAWTLGGSFAAELYRVSPADPATFGLVSVALGAVGLAACVIPARRAMRLDPVAAMKR